MTTTVFTKDIYKTNHTLYGGMVYPSDFNTGSTYGNIALRIENDKKFDEQCRKNILNRQKYGGHSK